MFGTIVNRYTTHSTEVEIIEVESATRRQRFLVAKREYEGGKVHLEIFSPDKHVRVSETINRNEITRVLSEGENAKYPYATVRGDSGAAAQAA